jgi:ADP-heptose:LPS heptosyltransferase
MDVNYLQFTHELAEVPYIPEPKFFPTEDEALLATDFNADKLTGFGILWGLSGSSLHKFYPWQDQVIARIMKELPEATIVTTGDGACQLLQQGWEKEPRITLRAGLWSMRRVLTQAQFSHLVIGPETGVLNAVAHEQNKKVVFLSHSTENNLTRDWVNTTAMIPDTKIAPCYPCHQLHYNRSVCPRHEETTAAMCAAAIDPDKVFEVIKAEYDKWSE